MFTDLFPETLVVRIVDGQPMTSSLEIANCFGRQHKDVMRAINSLLARTQDEGRRRNFAPSSYRNAQDKRQPMYLLNRSAFFFVVGGFTGEAADEWKWRFIDAFNAMESELHARTTSFAKALDQVRPNLRPTVEDAQADLPRATTARRLGKSPGSITYHRRQARRLGLLPATRGAA